MTYLFVYGTLRSGFHNRYARMLRNQAVLVGGGQVQGRVYRMFGYPALRLARSCGFVRGELYAVRDPNSLFKVLDRYEGRSYRRVICRAQLNERAVYAWVYEWRWRLPAWRSVGLGS